MMSETLQIAHFITSLLIGGGTLALLYFIFVQLMQMRVQEARAIDLQGEFRLRSKEDKGEKEPEMVRTPPSPRGMGTPPLSPHPFFCKVVKRSHQNAPWEPEGRIVRVDSKAYKEALSTPNLALKTHSGEILEGVQG